MIAANPPCPEPAKPRPPTLCERPDVDLKVPITITDELSDDVIDATGLLNLASGEIERVEYAEWDVDTQGQPFEHEDYEFSCGILSNNGKDVEFRVDINRATGQYSVSASELLEIKVRAAALFAGVSGPQLAISVRGAPKPAAPPAGADKDGPPTGSRGRKGRAY